MVTGLALLMTALMVGLNKPAHTDSIDDYLKAQKTAGHIPGLSIAVVQDGKVVKAQGYGLSNPAKKTPATADTVYQIGSLTKQFTAAAILTLAQQGKVGIDNPVSTYVEGIPAAWKPITVRELLNQTSGICSYTDALGDSQDGAAKDYTVSRIIALANTKPLGFTPGSQYAYSNTNYYLLGLVIEKVSGKSYADYMRLTFFGPLGMTQTRMYRPGLVLPTLAVGSLWDGTAVHVNTSVLSPALMFSAGGIVSTVTDLAKWDAALDGDALLNADSKRLLWTPPVLASGAATEYAGGWFVSSVKSHKLIWHNGATSMGFTGAIFKFPADKLTLIVLTNSLDIPGMQTRLPLYSLGLDLAKLYLPDLAKEEQGIPDTDPKTAALLKVVSAQIASGTLDKSLFTPAYQPVLTPEALQPLHDLLAPLGPITSLTLLRREPDGSAVYRARYGTRTVNWLIVVNKDYKISAILGRGAL